MRKLFLGAATAALFFAIGCKSGPSLQGEWEASGMGASQLPPGMAVTMKYGGSDLTITMVMNNEQVGTIAITGTGTYKLEGEKYSHEIKDVKFDTSKVKPEIKAMVEAQMKPDDLKKQMNQNTTMTVKFNEDGTVAMTGGTSTVTLKKKQ
jgi:hypothetical protein